MCVFYSHGDGWEGFYSWFHIPHTKCLLNTRPHIYIYARVCMCVWHLWVKMRMLLLRLVRGMIITNDDEDDAHLSL